MSRKGRGRSAARAAATFASWVRECCPTSIREDHLEGCVRQPGRCRSKAAYRTREFARRQARLLSDVFGRMTAYHCRSCGLYHVGHPTQEED